jgi:hypothetical protein
VVTAGDASAGYQYSFHIFSTGHRSVSVLVERDDYRRSCLQPISTHNGRAGAVGLSCSDLTLQESLAWHDLYEEFVVVRSRVAAHLVVNLVMNACWAGCAGSWGGCCAALRASLQPVASGASVQSAWCALALELPGVMQSDHGASAACHGTPTTH